MCLALSYRPEIKIRDFCTMLNTELGPIMRLLVSELILIYIIELLNITEYRFFVDYSALVDN